MSSKPLRIRAARASPFMSLHTCLRITGSTLPVTPGV
jgi:hypothetical protein